MSNCKRTHVWLASETRASECEMRPGLVKMSRYELTIEEKN